MSASFTYILCKHKSTMVLLTFVVVAIFLTVLWYYIKRVYFTLHGPLPGLPPQFLFGNLLQTGFIWYNVPFNLIFLDLKANFGDIFQYWLAGTRIIVVSRLEDVQHIFGHRYIYDQADIFTEKLSLINSDTLFCMKGLNTLFFPFFFSLETIRKILGASFKRHLNIVSPLFRRSTVNTYLEPIIDCTDKLLTRWRTYKTDSKEIHLNMIEQCQQLLLAIFGYVAFDYDFQTLDDEYNSHKNELTDALRVYLGVEIILTQLPKIIGRIYLLLNLKYQRARLTINRHLEQMIEQELRQTPDMRSARKRTSLIAALVNSLQQDEKLEANKSDEDKKG